MITQQTKDDLKQFIERLERLDNDKAALNEDVKFVYSQIKNNGFDVKIVRKILKARKADLTELAEEQCLFDIYAKALDMNIALDDSQPDMFEEGKDD